MLQTVEVYKARQPIFDSYLDSLGYELFFHSKCTEPYTETDGDINFMDNSVKKDIPKYKINYIQIIQQINQPELECRQIENIIKRDFSLAYKLLSFINSSIFGFQKKIKSLRHALKILGKKKFINYVLLVVLKEFCTDKSGELIIGSLIRGRFAKSIASSNMLEKQVANAFLLGIFAYLDVLLEHPLQEILDGILLDEEVKRGLLGKDGNLFSIIYNLILAYEKGDWESYSNCVEKLGIDERYIMNSYKEAVVWTHDLVMCNRQ